MRVGESLAESAEGCWGKRSSREGDVGPYVTFKAPQHAGSLKWR